MKKNVTAGGILFKLQGFAVHSYLSLYIYSLKRLFYLNLLITNPKSLSEECNQFCVSWEVLDG
jgi:hypothetical protein